MGVRMWRCRARLVLFYFVLLLGSFSGIAMRPKDIEESLHAHNQVKVEESTRNDDDDDDTQAKVAVAVLGK